MSELNRRPEKLHLMQEGRIAILVAVASILSVAAGGLGVWAWGSAWPWPNPGAWVALPWTMAAIIFGFVLGYLPIMLQNRRHAERLANEYRALQAESTELVRQIAERRSRS